MLEASGGVSGASSGIPYLGVSEGFLLSVTLMCPVGLNWSETIPLGLSFSELILSNVLALGSFSSLQPL